jgi:hypothetical protein
VWMKDESPIAAVCRVIMREFEISPTNTQAMMIIEAVRDSSPPPPAFTIAALRSILRTLEPHQGLEGWASRSAGELVRLISKHPAVQAAAKLIDDERLWCSLEGTIMGMLIRVTRGQDLVEGEDPKVTTVEELVEEINEEMRKNPDHPYTRTRDLNDWGRVLSRHVGKTIKGLWRTRTQ